MEISPLQSFTVYATDMLMDWRDEVVSQAESANESSKFTRMASEGGFLLLGLVGVVETVFRSFLFLSVGGIWLCLPQQWAADWKANYGSPTLENAVLTSLYTIGNFATVYHNFSGNELDMDNFFDSYVTPELNFFRDNGWIGRN